MADLTPKKPDPKAPKVAEPRHSPRKIKGFVDTQPAMYRLSESVDERLDQLIRFGLGDPARLAFYRRALSDPRGAVQSAVYREYVADSLSRLLGAILSDPSLYLRVRTVLQGRMRGPQRLSLEDVALEAMRGVMETRARVQEAAVGNQSDKPDPEDTPKRVVPKKHPRKPRDPE